MNTMDDALGADTLRKTVKAEVEKLLLRMFHTA